MEEFEKLEPLWGGGDREGGKGVRVKMHRQSDETIFFIIKILIKSGRILFVPFELRSRKFGQQDMSVGQPTEDGLYSNLTLHFPHLKRLKN
jgi:hypothetical protein